MLMFTNFLRSLLLTIIFSFFTPMFFLGGVLVFVSFIGYIPTLQYITEAIAAHIMQFLTIFGSGNPLHGLFIISLTCSFVGALFDTYVYYRYQILR